MLRRSYAHPLLAYRMKPIAQLTAYLRMRTSSSLSCMAPSAQALPNKIVLDLLKQPQILFLFSEPRNKNFKHEFLARCFLFQRSLNAAANIGKGLGKTRQVNQINYIHKRLTLQINYQDTKSIILGHYAFWVAKTSPAPLKCMLFVTYLIIYTAFRIHLMVIP